jgi:hypothetical protein
MSNAVFLEYRFNPEREPYQPLFNRLTKLGFTQRSKHSVSNVEVWVQARAILLIHPDYLFSQPGQIMGLGTVSKSHPMDELPGVYLDELTDFYAKECDNGFKFYFTETESLTHLYKVTNSAPAVSSGITAFGGLVISSTNKDIKDTLEVIAEKVEKSDKYSKYIFKNKFTIFLKEDSDEGVELLVSETVDVFSTTSYISARDIRTVQFEDVDVSKFGSMAHKIKGYNCKPFGNEHSYSIENYIPKEDFNVDLVFRSRKKYIKIKEDTLDYYDSIETK